MKLNDPSSTKHRGAFIKEQAGEFAPRGVRYKCALCVAAGRPGRRPESSHRLGSEESGSWKKKGPD